MKIFKIALIASIAMLAYFADLSPQTSTLLPSVQFVSEAEAVLGVRRRARRRGVAVGYAAGESAAHSEDAAAATAATTTTTTTTAQPAAAAAPPPSYGPLADGTVVSALPDGCTSEAVGGVEYYHCGENYFRSAFQGNQLMYVSGKPAGS